MVAIDGHLPVNAATAARATTPSAAMPTVRHWFFFMCSPLERQKVPAIVVLTERRDAGERVVQLLHRVEAGADTVEIRLRTTSESRQRQNLLIAQAVGHLRKLSLPKRAI